MSRIKQRKSLTIDDTIYKEFQTYALCIGRTVSSLVEEHMRNVLKEIKKEK
jgi:hypothetical protein|nr:MAG TPA: antitoxin [Caudoviricetes sp.]